ncbi:MAG: RsmB/NOP family class I SAM-dependent RNA methyltransferase [Alphaproteobacteria bacterium]|nr:RsmB/NOP family class I SAM-dependent RNA methyltransferase [Alphaproteobacteria bacterium]
MTPGARAAAAIEILDAIEADRSRPADRLIAAWFRGRRYAGGGDRREIRDLVYTVSRRRAQIDWWIERSGGRRDSRGRVLAVLLLEARWGAAQLEAAFDGGQYRPSPLDRQERALTVLAGRPYGDPAQPLDVRCNIPAWLAEPFRVVLGETMERELAALSEEAPVDLRVNALKATRRQVMARLAARGIGAEPTPFAPFGLRLNARVNLGDTPLLREGLVEPQDESSQIAALLVEAQPGESVVDFCAGGGGKSLALAAAMENRGRLVAADISRHRLARAAPRLARAGVTCAEQQTLPTDGGYWRGAEEGGFDRVLVDAPCSGTGTWRRNPENRWRLGEQELADYQGLQARILDRASRLVAPGGRLVYAVCSLLAMEGEGQIREFLARNPGFEALPVRPIWARAVAGECPANDVFLRLLPGREGTDGFFVAVMRRG